MNVEEGLLVLNYIVSFAISNSVVFWSVPGLMARKFTGKDEQLAMENHHF